MKNNFDLKNYMKENKVGAFQQLNEMWYQDMNEALGDFNTVKEEEKIEEKGDVKSIGQAGKMAHANTRTNLGRHRSSDVLDKQVAKDHDKNTIKGDKAAAYKAPHMKEGEEVTLNDLNTNLVITPFELEKTWKDMYGEDFKTEYSGAYSYLKHNYKNMTILDLGNVWERMYGEDFLQEYPGIAKWLFSNNGKAASKDKKVPTIKEDESAELSAIERFVTKSTEDYKDWDWDGETLTVFGTDGGVEKYSKQDLMDAGVLREDEEGIMSDKDFIDANWNDEAETFDWEKDIKGKQIGNWTADEEPQAGSIVWDSPKYDALIYATPGWEGANGIAVEVYELDSEGYIEWDQPMLQKVVGAGTDSWKTEEGYLALMAKILTTLEKALKPKQEMEEDHGTAVDHDKLDNVSKDPSEFEDSVNEDEDPFGAIKTGIDTITQNDDQEEPNDTRFYDMGGDQIKAGIESLIDDGFDFREIIAFVKQVIMANRRK